MNPSSRGILLGLLGVMVGAGLAGCASIPQDGAVEQVDGNRGLGSSTVRYVPPGPVSGAPPAQVVRGFLDAMLAYPESVATAAEFLTPRAALDWDADDGVTVYTAPRVSDSVETAGEVVVSTTELARLDRRGDYRPIQRRRSTTFRLDRIEGEWRIANPPSGLAVSQTYFGAYYRPFQVFFFDEAERRLVPELRHFPVGEQLATALVASLAAGPVASALRSYLPPEDTLRSSAPVTSGIADVEMTAELGALPPGQRQRLAAQVVWTLRQVPEVTGVRILGSTAVLSPSGNRVHSVSSWSDFGPPTPRQSAYALAGDRLVRLSDTDAEPVAGPWGRGVTGARAMALDDDRLVLVGARGADVLVAERSGEPLVSLDARAALRPVVDADDLLWVVDADASGSRIRVVDGTEVVEVGRLAGRVSEFAVSPTAARLAVVVDGRIRVIEVRRRQNDDSVTGLGRPRTVPADLVKPRSLLWSSQAHLTVLSQGDIREISIDGSPASPPYGERVPVPPGVTAARLTQTAGTDPTRWLLGRDGSLWRIDAGTSWSRVDAATAIDIGLG